MSLKCILLNEQMFCQELNGPTFLCICNCDYMPHICSFCHCNVWNFMVNTVPLVYFSFRFTQTPLEVWYRRTNLLYCRLCIHIFKNKFEKQLFHKTVSLLFILMFFEQNVVKKLSSMFFQWIHKITSINDLHLYSSVNVFQTQLNIVTFCFFKKARR